MSTESVKIFFALLWILCSSISFMTFGEYYNLILFSISFTYNIISNFYFNEIFSKKYDVVPCFVFVFSSTFINIFCLVCYDISLAIPNFVFFHVMALTLPIASNFIVLTILYNKLSILKNLPNNHQFVLQEEEPFTNIKV